MSDPSNRQERKLALAQAKATLEQRRKAREQLKSAREERQRTEGNTKNFGRQYVENFMKIIKETEKLQSQTRSKGLGSDTVTTGGAAGGAGATGAGGVSTQGTKSSKYRAPGRRRVLEPSDYTIYSFKEEKKVETYDKEIGTDPIVFDEYLTDILKNEFDEKTMSDSKEKEKIYAEFMKSEEVNAWPPVLNKHGRSISIGAGLLKPGIGGIGIGVGVGVGTGTGTDGATEEKAEWEIANEELMKQEEEEVLILPYDEANILINSGNFLDNFNLKSKWMERALGINEEMAFTSGTSGNDNLLKFEDISFDMTANAMKGGMDEIRTQLKNIENQKKYQKDLLTLKKQFINNRFEARPIGWIEFSNINPDWFLSCYSRRDAGDSFSSEPEGCVAIWNFVIPHNPEYLLYADSMVSTARFHPTHNSIIFGATLSGQILEWDIRTNNYSKPVSRTNFAHGHSSPVFGMSFLPSMNSKNHHFVSVSNDGKVCMWRDNDLSESASEIILRVDEATDKQASLLMGGNTINSSHGHTTTSSSSRSELGTSCFSYSTKEWNTMTFGSDEGNIYKAEIHGGGKSNDDTSGSGKSKNKGKNESKISGINASVTGKKVKDGLNTTAGSSSSAIQQSEYVNVLECVGHAHEGPITNICYNPCLSNTANTIQKQQLYGENISTLYLTSSFDWTVKLWHSKWHTRGPISIFDNMTDYVYDVKWSNIKPSVFACGDGNGQISLFNLNEDFNSPIGNVSIPKEKIFGKMNANNNSTLITNDNGKIKAVTKLEFTKNGKFLMAGDSDGMIHMYSLHKNLYTNSHDEYDTLVDKIQRKVKDFAEKEQ